MNTLQISPALQEFLLTIWNSIVFYATIGIITVVVIGLVAWIIIKILRGTLQRTMNKAKVPETLTKMGLTVLGFIYWYFVALTILNALGLKEISLALGGVFAFFALAAGLAMSGLIKDLVSGAYLVRDKDFGVNFNVKAGGVEGRVVEVDIRKTRILDKEGKLHVLPNNTVESAEWIVYERPKET